jgi:hypothetical protein
VIYENNETLAAEQAVANNLCKLWFVTMNKPSGFGRDRLIFDARNKQVGTLEIKVRNIRKDDWPTYMIDLSKLVSLRDDCDNGLVGILVVVFLDWVGWVCPGDWKWSGNYPDMEVKQGGRHDRNDPRDIDQCAFIPIERFRSVFTTPIFA